MLFIDCNIGEVVSTHDARILNRSELFSHLTEQRGQKFVNDTHLVGDKAYPCLPTLIVPYKDNGHLNQNQRHFNYRLYVVRSIIEKAFALLRKRFRCTKFLDIKNIGWGCHVFYTIYVFYKMMFSQLTKSSIRMRKLKD
ncbi:hypothetical protein NQ314_002217 [Rhamnusium bicolor]|uniref:DDE Tnp4 domain-containing protein n=1 Tax=Rhamnusium bicolor TaxID=1586634 RepID=A0AAV8ZQI6_9CUCU|nr:hypothetical protein NQ314_002217 [Rhamnusium bicolor]